MAETTSTWRAYRTIVGSRIRSQLAYRTSFVLMFASAAGIGAIEFTETYVILHNVPVFGGLDFPQAALVFALANLAFSLADLVFGQLDSIPPLIRMGQLEALLVRPMPLMAQLVTSDFQLRRLGRSVLSLVVLVVVLPQAGVLWRPATVVLLLVTPLVGALIYGALFATAGGVQFFLVDGSEFTSSFVYGGSYAGQLPGSVLVAPVRVLFTFVVPATVVSYLPTLVLLGLPGPAYLPSWLGWCGPAFAVSTWGVAGLTWRAGIRRFTGAGG